MKPDTISPQGRRMQRWLWFIGLWLASVLVLTLVAYLIRLVLLL